LVDRDDVCSFFNNKDRKSSPCSFSFIPFLPRSFTSSASASLFAYFTPTARRNGDGNHAINARKRPERGSSDSMPAATEGRKDEERHQRSDADLKQVLAKERKKKRKN